MAIPTFTMRQLLEAGVHFATTRVGGTRAWNHLFLVNAITSIFWIWQMCQCLVVPWNVRETVSKGGRVLFVGTKRVAADKIAETARPVVSIMLITAGLVV